MPSFAVEYSEDARHELRSRSKRLRAQIVAVIRALAKDPEPPESDPMWGEWAGHRRRHVAGMLRVVYKVDYRARLIDIVRIGPRGWVYD